MVIAVSMGLFGFGIMIVTTAINAYVLDSYPEAPGEVSAWINAGRTVGGFIITYFEIEWAAAEGTAKSLGIQAAAVAAAVLVFVVPLQFWGKRMRLGQGRMEQLSKGNNASVLSRLSAFNSNRFLSYPSQSL